MKKRVRASVVFLSIGLCVMSLGLSLSFQTARATSESSTVSLEALRADAMGASGGLIFIGSSSIRFWSTLEEDFAPLPVTNRGVGGSRLRHVVRRAPEVLFSQRPTAIVIYAGENDFAGPQPKNAAQLFENFKLMMTLFDREIPDTPIYYLSIKPTRFRWQRWPTISAANELIASMAETHPRLRFVDVSTPMLGEDGEPRPELFRKDGLHLSAEGYELWTSIVRPILLERFSPKS